MKTKNKTMPFDIVVDIIRYNRALKTQEAGPLNANYPAQNKNSWLETAMELEELSKASKTLSRKIRKFYEA